MLCLEQVSGHTTVAEVESRGWYPKRELERDAVRNERWKLLNWGYKRYALQWDDAFIWNSVVRSW